MSTIPHLSVIMGVYNNANLLNASIQSILDQTFEDFEFIIINDGSTDQSQIILQNLANLDPRIRLYEQENQGLTKTLIRACELSRARYIARQDVGDISLLSRFQKQLDYLHAHENCPVVFCDFLTVDNQANVICENRQSMTHVKDVLDIEKKDIATPSHHGTAMFVKSDYLRAGGYRKEFYFAQDLDLWVRLNECGEIHVINELLYHCLINANAISGKFHRFQKQFHQLIIDSARLRAQGKSDQQILQTASQIKPSSNRFLLNSSQSETYYFMASCLLKKQPELAQTYLKKALGKNPFNFKAWYKLVLKH